MEIWQEIVADQERGTRRLVAECGDRMFTAAFLLCRDQTLAEDLVFRTFVRAVHKIGQYREQSSFYSWLYSILLNQYRSDCRKMKPGIFDTGELPEDATSAWGEVREPLGADEHVLASELEARYRTAGESAVTALRSDKFNATIIIFK